MPPVLQTAREIVRRSNLVRRATRSRVNRSNTFSLCRGGAVPQSGRNSTKAASIALICPP